MIKSYKKERIIWGVVLILIADRSLRNDGLHYRLNELWMIAERPLNNALTSLVTFINRYINIIMKDYLLMRKQQIVKNEAHVRMYGASGYVVFTLPPGWVDSRITRTWYNTSALFSTWEILIEPIAIWNEYRFLTITRSIAMNCSCFLKQHS